MLLDDQENPEPEFLSDRGDYDLIEEDDDPPSGGRYRDPYPLSAGGIVENGFVVSFAEGNVLNPPAKAFMIDALEAQAVPGPGGD